MPWHASTVMCGTEQAVSDHGRRAYHARFEERAELAPLDMRPVMPAKQNERASRFFCTRQTPPRPEPACLNANDAVCVTFSKSVMNGAVLVSRDVGHRGCGCEFYGSPLGGRVQSEILGDALVPGVVWQSAPRRPFLIVE
jgi:hypothetical protein